MNTSHLIAIGSVLALPALYFLLWYASRKRDPGIGGRGVRR